MKYINISEVSDNPWLPIEYKESTEELPETQYRDAFTCYNIDWINEPSPIFDVRFEMRNVKTNKTKMVTHLTLTYPQVDEEDDPSQGVKIVWDQGNWKTDPTLIDVADVEVRYAETDVRRIKFIHENIKVGDFVKCKGTRSGDWNKVEYFTIGDPKKDDIIFGPKYSRPEEGYMRYMASGNALGKITKIVRDGKEIL